MLNQYATTQNITDRAAQSGDTVNIDYSGAVDGVAFYRRHRHRLRPDAGQPRL
ncbi:MAG: hypothetical protein ACLVJH_16700 [Faecalibacterium prausnitzii]